MFAKELLDSLAIANVRYCVVGGVAVNLHIALTFVDANNPLREVDVLVAPSLDPSGVVSRAQILGSGISVASIPDLIRLKERANRKQDLADIAHLRKLLP